MTKFAAYLFVVLVGSNFLNYYSKESPFFTYFLLASLAVTVFALLVQGVLNSYGYVAIKKFLSSGILLWVSFLSLSMLLMVLSQRMFQRGALASHFFSVLVFCIGVFVGLDKNLRWGVLYGALTIVLLGVGTNLFEFFVHNNMWSVSPGRSGGLYVNPNVSAGNLVAYSIMYFAFRPRHLKPFDYFVLAVVFAGILVTFSRTGYLLYVLTISMVFLARSGFDVKAKSILQFGGVLVVVAALIWLFVEAILPEMPLSTDASRRLASVTGATVGQDFSEERSGIAVDAWNLFLRSPFTGAGVRTSLEMKTGPHNMYVATAVDFGIFGLAAYVALTLWLLWSGFRKARFADESWLIMMTSTWLAIYSLASHNILYDSPNLLALSISVALASVRLKGKHRNSGTVSLSAIRR